MKPMKVIRWAGGTLLAGAALWAMIAGSMTDTRRNALAAEHLHRLEEVQAGASESVLKLRYGLTNNYDGVNQLVLQMQQSRDALGTGPAAIVGRGDAGIDAHFKDYATALEEYRVSLEQFKSRNAVLKNSLQHFSAAASEIRQRLQADNRSQGFDEHLGRLLFATLRFATGSDEDLLPVITEEMAHVRDGIAGLSPDLRRSVRNVLDHADVIIRVRPELDLLTRDLVFPRTAQPLDDLGDAFAEMARAQEQRAIGFRYALGLLAAMLGVLVVAALLRIARNMRQIEENHRFLDRISDNVGDGLIATDKNGRVVFANREALRLSGWSKEELIGRDLHETCCASGGGALPGCKSGNGGIRRLDAWFSRRDGSTFPVSLVDVPIAEPGELGAVTVFRDMTEVLERDKDLRLAASVFDHSPYGITVTDPQARILRVNPSFCAITGFSPEDVLGQNPRLLQSGTQPASFYEEMWRSLRDTGQWRGELRNRRKNGEIYPEWLNIRAVKNAKGELTHYVGIFLDLSEYKEAEQQLEYLSHYDTLTGLPNRVLFQDRLNRAIAQAHRSGRLLGLIFLGLDRFQVVNDSLGHEAGDTLLKLVARRLEQSLRDADTVCRMGGDQFAMLLDNMPSITDVAAKAQDLLRAFERPFDINGNEVFCTISIGATLCPLDADDAAALQRNADTAMFRAKEMGRNTIQFYSPEMSAGVAETMRLEGRLRRALETGELSMCYQPQVSLDTPPRVVGMEALLRWKSAEYGVIDPVRFIPIAEKSGMIISIGEWVLRTACAQCREWQQAGLPPMRMAVNLSAVQLRQPGLVERVHEVLRETGLEARYLELEITESVVMEDVERSIAVLEGLRRLGCEVAIDDFGTGYSSLSYLKHFPVDTLKIDQSFIRGIGSDTGDTAVVNAIISLGESLSLKIVAEGVETLQQIEALRARADRAPLAVQGFYFCRPRPAPELRTFLEAAAPLAATVHR